MQNNHDISQDDSKPAILTRISWHEIDFAKQTLPLISKITPESRHELMILTPKSFLRSFERHFGHFGTIIDERDIIQMALERTKSLGMKEAVQVLTKSSWAVKIAGTLFFDKIRLWIDPDIIFFYSFNMMKLFSKSRNIYAEDVFSAYIGLSQAEIFSFKSNLHAKLNTGFCLTRDDQIDFERLEKACQLLHRKFEGTPNFFPHGDQVLHLCCQRSEPLLLSIPQITYSETELAPNTIGFHCTGRNKVQRIQNAIALKGFSEGEFPIEFKSPKKLTADDLSEHDGFMHKQTSLARANSYKNFFVRHFKPFLQPIKNEIQAFK